MHYAAGEQIARPRQSRGGDVHGRRNWGMREVKACHSNGGLSRKTGMSAVIFFRSWISLVSCIIKLRLFVEAMLMLKLEEKLIAGMAAFAAIVAVIKLVYGAASLKSCPCNFLK